MPENKTDINVKNQSIEGQIPQRLKDFMKNLRDRVSNDNDSCGNWKLKQIVANNQRLGIKRYTNKPYPGAPDIPLPEADKLIKKSIPTLVTSSWAVKNMALVRPEQGVDVTPEMKDKARKSQKVLNHVLRKKETDWFHKLMLAADQAKQSGFCLFKVFEDFFEHCPAHFP